MLSSPSHAQLAFKFLADETGSTTGDVDVLAYQVTIHAGYKIFWIEVHVFNMRIQLGSNVIAQPFRIHADIKVTQWRNAGAT